MTTAPARTHTPDKPVNYGKNWLVILSFVGVAGGIIMELIGASTRPRLDDLAALADRTEYEISAALSSADTLQTVGLVFIIVGAAALLLLLAVGAIRFELERATERVLAGGGERREGLLEEGVRDRGVAGEPSEASGPGTV